MNSWILLSVIRGLRTDYRVHDIEHYGSSLPWPSCKNMHCMAGLHPHLLTEPRESSLKATIDGSKRLFIHLHICWPRLSGLETRLVVWLPTLLQAEPRAWRFYLLSSRRILQLYIGRSRSTDPSMYVFQCLARITWFYMSTSFTTYVHILGNNWPELRRAYRPQV